MSRYRKVDPRIWNDADGTCHPVPQGSKLRPTERRGHARIRAFVFRRDRFHCLSCGAVVIEVPADYDGSYPLYVDRRTSTGFPAVLHLDHIQPRCRGGSHHPANLQCLCEVCNCAKAGRA